MEISNVAFIGIITHCALYVIVCAVFLYRWLPSRIVCTASPEHKCPAFCCAVVMAAMSVGSRSVVLYLVLCGLNCV